MLESIIVAIITGTFSLLAVIAENRRTLQKAQAEFDKTQAVMKERISELAKNVEKHNNVIERTYHLEEKCAVMDEQIKVANHRISDIEQSYVRRTV